MNRNRSSNARRQSSRDSIERRMDQWVETGRQLVDGVAGNRPGQRRKDTRTGLNDMGRWVGEKIDWFFEDEEDWSESLESFTESTDKSSLRKRPLTAISLRVPKVIAPSSSQATSSVDNTDQWPDQASFKIERWEREPVQNTDFRPKPLYGSSFSEKNSQLRPLPKSSRRKN